MKIITKRLTALLLALTMSLSLITANVWAGEEWSMSAMSGEEEPKIAMESAAEGKTDVKNNPRTEEQPKAASEGAAEDLPEAESHNDAPDTEMEQSSSGDGHSDTLGDMLRDGENKTNCSDAEERAQEETRSGEAEERLLTLADDDKVKLGRAGWNLIGPNQRLYLRLAQYIKQVADGERTSTVFEVDAKDLDLVETSWTAEDLGLNTVEKNGVITDEARDAVRSKFSDWVFGAWFYDLPYELYWSDYNAKLSDSSICLRNNNGLFEAYLTDILKFEFSVLKEYADSDQFTVKSDIAQPVQEAVNNAKDIIARYAGKTDYEKLDGYRKEICELVSYSDQGVSAHRMFPVFDNDSTTNAACEGYSRAFKYLCDMTEFSDPSIYCIIVTGGLDERSSNHMWNIVHMEDGNYLVDVTNCDEGWIGEPKQLFLAGYDSGSLEKGYTFKCKKGNCTYYYDAQALVGYYADDLTLSKPTIELDETSLKLEAEKEKTLKATVKGPNKEVTWKSSNKKIATVDKNGKVTAKKKGKCTITATANGVSASCKVKVRSEKEAAIEAYRELLSQDTINWLNDPDLSNPSKEYSFCLAYLDDDDIPELIMYYGIDMHWAAHCSLYAYVNGKVKFLTSEMYDSKNYKRKGVYIDCLEGNGGYWYTNYYIYKKGKIEKWLYYQHTMDWNKQTEKNDYYKYKSKKRVKIKKSEFDKLLKKKVGPAKAKKFSLHKNTKGNRKKYLK